MLTFWGQNVGPGWVKMVKKVVFTLATLLPTQFSLKTKFLPAIVSLHIKQIERDELTDLHKVPEVQFLLKLIASYCKRKAAF